MFHYFKKRHGLNLDKSPRRKKKSPPTRGHNSRLLFESLEPRWVLDSTMLDLQPVSLPIDFTTSQPILPLAETSSTTLPRQMEELNRGIVAVRSTSNQVYVGWRLFGTDPSDISFNLYRSTGGGAAVKLNATPLTTTTDYVDTPVTLTQTNAYYVRPVIGGVEQAPSETYILAASAPVQQYLSVPLQIPPDGTTPSGEAYTYSANDCSVGDVDGDGAYEIIVKWDPSNAKDNAQSGYTGNVYLDAYEMNGTRLWRIDLGKNIRAGAHYTQFVVYDLDGDGKAEVACKTGDGTITGTGQVIGDSGADYRETSGYILSGPEYLTIFNGQTGAAMTTTPFYPDRGSVSQWGDTYGNRVDRFLAGVAYLDGVRPSLIMVRGYYPAQYSYGMARNEITAWNWRDDTLTQQWWFRAGYNISNNYNVDYINEGNHNLSIGDVDGDGKDEIVYGACAIDDDGTPLYDTNLHHGDAMHLGDLDPTRPGLEVWSVHENPSNTAGGEFRDAATGELIWGVKSNGDVGRGVSDDIWAGTLGAESWVAGGSIYGLYDCHGNYVGRVPSSTNFLVWWDSDHVRELLDGTSISKYGLSSDTTLLTASGCASNNGTKSTPALSVDLFGDWREEVIWRTTDSSALRIYTTTNAATDRIYTLMHDPQYRLSIAWQNAAYNQPPHTGFYLGDGMSAPPTPNIYLVSTSTVPPDAPTGLTPTVISPSQIDLSWTAASGATGYLIKRKDDSGGPYLVIASVIGGTSFSDTTVETGATYYYVVTAVNTSGESADTAYASASISLVSPWTSQDIGSVGIPGHATSAGGVFTLKGSALIYGGSGDAFQLCSQNISGDSSIIVKVQSLDPTNGSGGITLRKSTSATSAFVSVTLNNDRRIYINYRAADGGAVTSSYVSSVGSPQWLQLTRIGNYFRAYYSADGINWTQIGSALSITMPTSVLGGLMVASNSPGLEVSTIGTTIFSNVSVLAPGTNAGPTVATAAIGSPNPTTGNTTTLSVLGGDDLGEGNLTYAWATLGTPPAAVAFSVNGTNSAKNSVATFTQAGTYNFRVTITDAAGLTITSDTSVTVVLTLTSILLTPSSPLMISAGATQQFTAVAKDQFGVSWSQQPTFTWSLTNGAGTISSSGLYTSPASTSQSATVRVSGGGLSSTAVVTSLTTSSLFSTYVDIGGTNKAGSSTYSAGTYTVNGCGSDIWGTSDMLQFYYTAMTGDTTIIARVASVQNTYYSAKAGIMIRNHPTAATGLNAFVAITPGNGVYFQNRSSANPSTSTAATIVTGYTAPYWLKLVRSGNNFSGYRSADGVTWTQVGATVNIPMSTTVYVGLGVVSRVYNSGDPTKSQLCAAVFNNVSITGANTAPTVATVASATPNIVTGTTTNLSVLGSDNGGEANLTYTWATTGTPPAPVTYSINGTNDAKNTVATFSKSGSYSFQVTIRDTAGLTVTSTVNVTVNQTLTAITVIPSPVTLQCNGTQQFTAEGFDQFGYSMTTQPTFAWTAIAGTINPSTGFYTAPSTATTDTVTATSGGKNGTATVYVLVPASIAGRQIFYNNSRFDGHTGYLSGDPEINIFDNGAIATNKVALLPGETATFNNYTSFSRGINGIMVDIQNLANPTALTAADFQFKAGNDDDPSGWSDAPAPNGFDVRVDGGTGGSDRITITWANNAMENKWLQVTVLANDNTWLTAEDVFYFGNLIGESGDNPTVSIEDENAVLNNRTGFTLATVTSYYDYNRDRQVNATDALIARHNASATLYTLTGPLAAGDVLQPVSLETELVTAQPESSSELVSAPLSGESTLDSLSRQMEYLNRGVVAVRSSTTAGYISWRLLGTDPSNIAFNLYRSANGGAAIKLNSSPLTTTTNYVDTTATLTVSNAYFVRPVIGGVEQAASETYTLAASAPVQQFLSVPLQIPAGVTTPDGITCTYSANDCSVGDLDGDGQYEIIVKWDPSNSHDNADFGYSGNVYLDAYKLDGTLLWRIDLGINIRAGAHYTQFMVYDLDGDGRAEIACKTAPYTKDGMDNYVLMSGDTLTDYRNSSGYILSGSEYLTIFNGLTGAAMATTYYNPPRGNVSSWGDSYGNRVDRFLACVAYLDGTRPSLVMCRGYYTRCVLAAWDWRDGQLTQRWTFDSNTTGNGGYAGQGNHNLSVGDVDGDGKDEIIYGACAINDNGKGLYTTDLGHGDALYLADMDTSRPGLEVFGVHESPSSYGAYGGDFRNAGTGQLYFGIPGNGADVGRGCAFDIDPNYPGFESWTSADGNIYSAQGVAIYAKPGNMFQNFGVWWNADLGRELLDGTTISRWDYNTPGRVNLVYAPANVTSNNDSKKTPCLSADILGDWREEVIWRRSDNTALQIWTTTIPATNRIYTLMHDTQYRESIAWQNVAYNQPPHTSFYLGYGMSTPPTPNIYLVGHAPPTVTGTTPSLIESGGTAGARITQIAVNFSEQLNATDANAPGNYELRRSVNGIFGDGDDVVYVLIPNYVYNSQTGESTTTINLGLLGDPLPAGTYRFTTRGGGGAGGLRDMENILLDGDVNGLPGGDYVRTFTILPVTVAGRQVFYNNSRFDGHTGYLSGDPAANVYDDGAIASDKQARLPGDPATYANYTSFSRGLNGIMIDIQNLAGTPNIGNYTQFFQFKTGNDGNVGSWSQAPAPIAVECRAVSGATRVTVIWADNDIANKWLQVTVLANENIGLSEADVFYFGNLIGESGDNATVSVADENAALNNRTGFTLAAVTSDYDYNRDRQVNATDALIARHNTGASLYALTGPLAAGDVLQPLAAMTVLSTDVAIAPLYVSFGFSQVSQPLSPTLSARKAVGDQNIGPLANSLSSSAGNKRHIQQREKADVDKAFFHDLVLTRISDGIDSESETNWDRMNWIDEEAGSIINDCLLNKSKPARSAIDAFLAEYQQ